jgi:AcrR family transcriptional regulator
LVDSETSPKLGRKRSTTRDHIADIAIDLFCARGFDSVSVDDVAQAAGIARRTLFRYYPSKSAIPWGDFDVHLSQLRDLFAGFAAEVPLREALRSGLLAFNTFDAAEAIRLAQRHRRVRGLPAWTGRHRHRATGRGLDDARGGVVGV